MTPQHGGVAAFSYAGQCAHSHLRELPWVLVTPGIPGEGGGGAVVGLLGLLGLAGLVGGVVQVHHQVQQQEDVGLRPFRPRAAAAGLPLLGPGTGFSARASGDAWSAAGAGWALGAGVAGSFVSLVSALSAAAATTAAAALLALRVALMLMPTLLLLAGRGFWSESEESET